MTAADYLRQHVIPAACALLPTHMTSRDSLAMVLAIALQESGCASRVQLKGPARSFWQFERGGIGGVLTHPASAAPMTDVLTTLRYTRDVDDLYAAIAHNDVLAACFARLLLWTSPAALPAATEAEAGWTLYESLWRPGKPRPADWPANFARGWDAAQAA